MKLQSTYTPEQCREGIRQGLRERLEDIHGFVHNDWFRLSVSEPFTFDLTRNHRVSYAVYGRICEGKHGRAEIQCALFLGITDPLQFAMVLLMCAVIVLIIMNEETFHIQLAAILGLSLSAAWLDRMSTLVFRMNACDQLECQLRNFFYEAAAAREE